MPTYEFRCPAGHDFERFYRSISNSPTEIPCPECGLQAIRKVSAGAGLVFKGSGFYITDYGKDGKKAEREAMKAKPASDASKPAVEGAKSSGTGGGESSSGDSSASKSKGASETGAKPSSGGGSSGGGGDSGGSSGKKAE
jgi:putative FmdB family regulatory protein